MNRPKNIIDFIEALADTSALERELNKAMKRSRFNVPFGINAGVSGSDGPEAQEGVFVGGDVGGSGGADEYPGGKGERAQARAGRNRNDDFPAVRTARGGEGDVSAEVDLIEAAGVEWECRR